MAVKGRVNMATLLQESTTYSTPEKIDDEDKTGLLERETVAGGTEIGTDADDGGVAGADGNVDRKALGEIVFEDRSAMRRLNAITHPAVKREILRRIRVLTSQGCRRIGLDVPLLYESGLDHVCDFVIGVVAPEPAREERIVRRDGISPEQARIRLAAQPDREFYEALCDVLIENDGDRQALRQSLEQEMAQAMKETE